MECPSQLLEYSQRFNQTLPDFFQHRIGQEKRVTEAMQYSVMNGGKRLRPFLVYETAKLFGMDFEQSLNCAVAIECLHSYSLIHDDLPAMDNDDLRRGKPTCHRAYDEATAILAGDGLLTYAFELLSSPKTHSSSEIRCSLITALSKSAGAFDGMIAGQMLDILSEQQNTNTDSDKLIKHIEEMKTGRLISFSCQAGALLGHASKEEQQALYEYSRNIGISFQITDDILDVTGNQELMGKKLQKDDAQGKITFVNLYGLEKAKQIVQELTISAQNALNIFGKKSQTLKDLAQFIADRNH